jgi:hypothetical protein
MTDAGDRYIAILRDILENPPDPARLAAEEAARTDPWRWYCRLCGATGEAANRQPRDELAREHLDKAPCGRYEVTGWASSGRLLHVWTYPASAVARLC